MKLEEEGSEKLKQLLCSLVRNVDFSEKEELACCGTTVQQCRAISEIGYRGYVNQKELAAVLRLDKTTISRTMDSLEYRGLAERVQNPADKRCTGIRLTEKGKDSYAEISRNMDAFYLKAYELLPPGKKEQVIESLALLVRIFEENKCC
jgi:DNA-binding MarR family transcriptional regulator